MTKSIIKVGDKTSHGGTVLTGDPIMTIDGVPVARIGDIVFCPAYTGDTLHGTNPIIGGQNVNRPLLQGRPAAVAGDQTACGSVLISTNRLAVAK